MIDHVRHFDALGEELVALLVERRLRARLEGEVIKRARHPEPAVDARVVLSGNARDTARLHERQELIAPRIEEDVADAPALLDLDDVAAHGLEPQHVFVEVAGLVEVQRRQPDVREPFVAWHRVPSR